MHSPGITPLNVLGIYRHAQQHILHYPDPNSGTEKRRFSDFVTYSPYLGRVPTLWSTYSTRVIRLLWKYSDVCININITGCPHT